MLCTPKKHTAEAVAGAALKAVGPGVGLQAATGEDAAAAVSVAGDEAVAATGHQTGGRVVKVQRAVDGEPNVGADDDVGGAIDLHAALAAEDDGVHDVVIVAVDLDSGGVWHRMEALEIVVKVGLAQPALGEGVGLLKIHGGKLSWSYAIDHDFVTTVDLDATRGKVEKVAAGTHSHAFKGKRRFREELCLLGPLDSTHEVVGLDAVGDVAAVEEQRWKVEVNVARGLRHLWRKGGAGETGAH